MTGRTAPAIAPRKYADLSRVCSRFHLHLQQLSKKGGIGLCRRRPALGMSASGGNREGHVGLLPEEQRCMERNGASPQWRHENNSRIPRHQIESGIKRAFAVVAETRRGSGILLRSPCALMRPAAAAASRNARIRVRSESRTQKREREQHQQRNGGETPQGIIVAQTRVR